VSNILVPPPPPDLPLEDAPVTQQSTAVRNSLSGLTGTKNNVPTLEDEMTAVVTPKMLKRQRLTNTDCGDAISKFADKTAGFYSSFSTYVENKAKADNSSFLFQLLDKLERGIITHNQFEEMKASFL
jgi:hypothetical protein